MKTEKELEDTIELTNAVVDFCQGYPARMSIFALMEAAAIILVNDQNQSAIKNAPLFFHSLIKRYCRLYDQRKSK